MRSVVRVGVLLAGDVLAFTTAVTLVRVARAGIFGESVAELVAWMIPAGTLSALPFGVAILFGLTVARAYGAGDRRRDARRVLMAVTIGATLSLWHELWIFGPRIGATFVVAVGTMTALVLAARHLIDRAVNRFWLPLQPAERVVFVGDPNHREATAICAHLSRAARMETAGWVVPSGAEGNGRFRGAGTEVLDRLWRMFQTAHVDTVVLCGTVPNQVFEQVVDACAVAGCRLMAPSRYDGVRQLRPSLVWYHRLPFIELTVPALRGRQLFLKRVLDLAVSTIGLMIASPILLVIGVAIKLDSPGPVLFRQERVGRGGRRFDVLKFRTMYHGVSDRVHREHVRRQLNGESGAGGRSGTSRQTFKLVSDARVTRVGAWLRRTSLDELPQLLNVFRGEMSLVGPRPPLAYEVVGYEPWQFDRLMVKPGITGLWQVSGRSRLSYRQMCELDVAYVNEWSLWLDLKILAKTAPVVLFNSGSAT